MNKMVGTQFHAVDFHIHTTASFDYKDKDAKPEDFVNAAIQAGLSAIAITDHNTPAGIAAVQSAAENSGLIVFPGVEITSQGGHVIALFDPAASPDIVEEVLYEAGISKGQWGEENALGKDILAVLAAINDKGGMAIAAHADGPKGFLTTLLQGQASIRIYKDPNLAALEIIKLDKKDQYVEGTIAGYDRAIPCIQGSDAHSLKDIGSGHTLLRMHRISLEGVRQAFAEPKLRIKLMGEWSPKTYPYIAGLRVSQGFLSNQPFQFNPNLNCIVGGAGSGKSTVIEFLRFALDQVSSMGHIADDCLGKLKDLAQTGASIEVDVVLESGEHISVTRFFDEIDNPILVKRISNGQVLNDVDVRKFFPVHAYSQGEAISIARSPLAQLELIDKHLDLRQYQDEIQAAYRELSEQNTGLAKLEAISRDRESVERNIATTSAQITGLTSEMEVLLAAQKSPVATSHQLSKSPDFYLEGAQS